VALIADVYDTKRRVKYFQALALSLPVLHPRWILDSLASGAAQPWPKYLLPAGESSYLSGAVRSRTLQPYAVESARFVDVVAGRQRLLSGGGVLLVVAPSEKARGKGRSYAFLSLALGARRVRVVQSAVEAGERVREDGGRWRWVHCDEKSLGAVRKVFAGRGEGGGVGADRELGGGGEGVGGRGKKRKRGQQVNVQSEGAGSTLSTSLDGFMIVGDEFVIQSLILGALVEE